MAIIIRFYNNGNGSADYITSTKKTSMLDVNPNEHLKKAFENGFHVISREFHENGDVTLYLN